MKNPINLALIEQLRMLGLDRFQLDGHLFARGHIGAKVNVPKRAAADLSPQAILLPDSQLHVVGIGNAGWRLGVVDAASSSKKAVRETLSVLLSWCLCFAVCSRWQENNK